MLRFFFQAEDGIRDTSVTGVQTCALPIFGALGLLRQQLQRAERLQANARVLRDALAQEGFEVAGSTTQIVPLVVGEIGRASCRERVEISVAEGRVKKKAGHDPDLKQRDAT